jgi:hypothetical protein
MKITILIVSFLFYGAFAMAQVPADSTAYFKDIAAKYKALGFPESGVELSGPMGGKAGADLGSVEISVQGGLRGEGAVPDLVNKMFGD